MSPKVRAVVIETRTTRARRYAIGGGLLLAGFLLGGAAGRTTGQSDQLGALLASMDNLTKSAGVILADVQKVAADVQTLSDHVQTVLTPTATPTPTPPPSPAPSEAVTMPLAPKLTPKPTPRPTPKPTPRPTPAPTPRPTPTPAPTPAPSCDHPGKHHGFDCK